MDTLTVKTTSVQTLIESQQSMIDSLMVQQKSLLASQADLASQIATSVFTTNNLWMMVATGLVFIMHLGFATLESGLTRSKNTINILFKNTLIPLIGLLTYALCGFSLMYPGFEEGASGLFAFAGMGITMPEGGETIAYNVGYTFWTDFLFQAMFAATCATIISGAVAERVKLVSFLFFSIFFVALIYPIIGSWKWGLGWLDKLGFYDFAGSTLVHSVGGWGALAGILLLGPRLGKYEGKKITPILGHNMTSAVIGVFLLWLGWFGFNGGSVLSANPGAVSRVLVTTSLAAAAGGFLSAITIFTLSKKFDLTMVLNGVLAGLVGITASADLTSVLDAVIIGGISGIIVVLSVLFIDKIKIDDPVGAVSVHLVCGIWGTMAVGLFGSKASSGQLMSQLIGIGACGIAAFAGAMIIFLITKLIFGLRVSQEEEIYGLDAVEHGMEAYPDFIAK